MDPNASNDAMFSYLCDMISNLEEKVKEHENRIKQFDKEVVKCIQEKREGSIEPSQMSG